MKIRQMRTKAIYSEFSTVKESAIISHGFAETQGQGEEWKSFIEDKKKGLQGWRLLGSCCQGEAIGGLTRSHPM